VCIPYVALFKIASEVDECDECVEEKFYERGILQEAIPVMLHAHL
jgi:hypothetical protein